MKHAQGRRFWLEQGTSDSITPIRFAKEAAKVLKKNGADVNLVEFKGGHGFAMPNPGESLRAALEWLDTRTGG